MWNYWRPSASGDLAPRRWIADAAKWTDQAGGPQQIRATFRAENRAHQRFRQWALPVQRREFGGIQLCLCPANRLGSAHLEFRQRQ